MYSENDHCVYTEYIHMLKYSANFGVLMQELIMKFLQSVGNNYQH